MVSATVNSHPGSERSSLINILTCLFLLTTKTPLVISIDQSNWKAESKEIQLMQVIEISFLGHTTKWKGGRDIWKSKQGISSTTNKLKYTKYWGHWINDTFPSKEIV